MIHLSILNVMYFPEFNIPLVLSMWIATLAPARCHDCSRSGDRVPEPVDQGLGQLALAVGHDSDRSRDIVPEPGSRLWNWLQPVDDHHAFVATKGGGWAIAIQPSL